MNWAALLERYWNKEDPSWVKFIFLLRSNHPFELFLYLQDYYYLWKTRIHKKHEQMLAFLVVVVRLASKPFQEFLANKLLSKNITRRIRRLAFRNLSCRSFHCCSRLCIRQTAHRKSQILAFLPACLQYTVGIFSVFLGKIEWVSTRGLPRFPPSGIICPNFSIQLPPCKISHHWMKPSSDTALSPRSTELLNISFSQVWLVAAHASSRVNNL